jgi:signal peptidase I
MGQFVKQQMGQRIVLPGQHRTVDRIIEPPQTRKGTYSRPGDVVTISIRAGDIIAFDGRAIGISSIVHRVVVLADEGDEGFAITMGDNNPAPDSGMIKPQQINGKVLFAVPLLGYPRLALYAVGI